LIRHPVPPALAQTIGGASLTGLAAARILKCKTDNRQLLKPQHKPLAGCPSSVVGFSLSAVNPEPKKSFTAKTPRSPKI
jgi:hypothetical protein